jgi:hypothetical protein
MDNEIISGSSLYPPGKSAGGGPHAGYKLVIGNGFTMLFQYGWRFIISTDLSPEANEGYNTMINVGLGWTF